MKEFTYRPQGVCSVQMHFVINDDDTIKSFDVIGGCRGNLQGVKALMIGLKVDDVIAKLEGIQCRNGTSCPDQISKALKANR